MTVVENSIRAALFAALARAQALAKSVEKDAVNKFHKYGYTSAEGMIAEAKQSLSACDLAVVPVSLVVRDPTVDERPVRDERGEAKGDANKGARCVLTAEWLVVHKEGGSLAIACEWPVIPENGRPLDKALAAARTASLNYLLRDLLQLPRVEEGTDLDDDSRDGHQHDEVPPRQVQRQPPARPVTDDQRERIRALNRAVGLDGDGFIRMFGKPETTERAAEVIVALEKMKAEKAAADATLAGAAVPPEAPAPPTGATAGQTQTTATSPSSSTTRSGGAAADGAVLDGSVTERLVLVKRKVDACGTAQAVAIALAELAETVEGLPKSARIIARNYAAAVIKQHNGESLTDADQRSKKALDDLVPNP